MIRFRDCDTGETTLDVVRVPEGFSLQLAYVADPRDVDPDFLSIVLDDAAAARLADALRSPRGSRR